MDKLITNLNLKPNKNHGQSIYNSQLYGTFFGVYAFLETKETKDTEVREITSMKLQVINYKGELDLGIEEAIYEPNGNAGDFSGGTLRITVKAMVSNAINRNKKVKTDNIEVQNIAGKQFERGKSFINVKRYVRPIHAEKSKDSIGLKKGVFDSEFHYREGIVFDKEYSLRPESHHIGGRPAEPLTKFADLGTAASGPFCPFAELFILWFG